MPDNNDSDDDDSDCESFDEQWFETNCEKLDGYCTFDFSVTFK